MVIWESIDVPAVVTDGYNMSLGELAGMMVFVLTIVAIVVFGIVSGNRTHAERLDNLQTCIEFDNPVEWCIEQFGG